MIYFFLLIVVIALVLIVAGLGSAFRDGLIKGILYIFIGIVVGAFGIVGIDESINSSQNEIKETSSIDSKIEICDPIYKMKIDFTFFPDYKLICSDKSEMDITKDEYNTQKLQEKEYEYNYLIVYLKYSFYVCLGLGLVILVIRRF